MASQSGAATQLSREPVVCPATAARRMSAVVYFERDVMARRAISSCGHHLRTSFESFQSNPREAEVVLVCSDERLLAENYSAARAPNVRVIALTNQPFRDPHTDGAVYVYLPTETPTPLIQRMIDNALDHIHLLTTRQEANERLAGATHEIHELNKIGAALSAEHDTGKLLEIILTKCREITKADAGSLYLVEEEPLGEQQSMMAERSGDAVATSKRLRFKLAQNDTVRVAFEEITLPISENSIAGYVALHGEVVMIEDSYHLPEGVPYSINRKFDEDSGYRTKSILAVPMRDQQGQTVGVVQLINAKRDSEKKLSSLTQVVQQVVPFNGRQEEIVSSLVSQAAVAFENSQLYASIQRLFEGFVKASVIAIESRDPTTSGHSFRVANLTVALAETIDRDGRVYRDVNFTRDQMREIRYASLLHDFGKVGVREEVLVKAKKLYPVQLELIEQRFHLVRRTLEAESSQRRMDHILRKGREEYLAVRERFDRDLEEQLARVERYFQIVLQANEPTVLPSGDFASLSEIASRAYTDCDGLEKTLLTGDEVRLLSIRKGSLDDTERLQIESHVVHTYNFLNQIPWTKEIKNIPQIARGHHEKLNGLGYPFNLSAPEIPLQTRMMTVSDVFDALSASDRPYKRAVSTERALEILGFMVKDGEIDSQVFDLFREARVFEKSLVESTAY